MKHMHLSEQGLVLLKKLESCKLVAYQDGAGKWTIGYGHTGPEVTSKTRWTMQQARAALNKDVLQREEAVKRLVFPPIAQPVTQGQFDALVIFVFNVGEDAFRTSTLRRKFNAGDTEGASAEFERWNKLRKPTGEFIVVPGLTNRRKAEAALFRST